MAEYTLQQIAEMVKGSLEGDATVVISGVASLDDAQTGQLSFLSDKRFRQHLDQCRASVVLVREDEDVAAELNLIRVKDPYLAYALVAQNLTANPEKYHGIHETAVVHPTAKVDASAYIGANAVVEAWAEVGADSYISAGCVVGERAVMGTDCFLHPNVTLYHGVVLGDRVRIHAGSVIGSDGFGYANDQGAWVKVPQLGKVSVGNDVEIGANCAIDRGAMKDTVICDGVIIDNLVHIAHNVSIGEQCAIAGHVGFAGSTTVGKRVMFGGMCGIAGHLEIADGAIFNGMSMVTRSIKEGGLYSSGLPAEKAEEWRRTVVRIRKLEKLEQRIKALETLLDKKEG